MPGFYSKLLSLTADTVYRSRDELERQRAQHRAKSFERKAAEPTVNLARLYDNHTRTKERGRSTLSKIGSALKSAGEVGIEVGKIAKIPAHIQYRLSPVGQAVGAIEDYRAGGPKGVITRPLSRILAGEKALDYLNGTDYASRGREQIERIPKVGGLAGELASAATSPLSMATMGGTTGLPRVLSP